MRIGLMWQVDSITQPIEPQIRAAAAYYLNKYGQSPTVCQVHPSRINGTTKVDEINVQPYRSVLPNLLWLGIESEETGK